jgi:type IV secretory pathway protease TraF
VDDGFRQLGAAFPNQDGDVVCVEPPSHTVVSARTWRGSASALASGCSSGTSVSR